MFIVIDNCTSTFESVILCTYTLRCLSEVVKCTGFSIPSIFSLNKTVFCQNDNFAMNIFISFSTQNHESNSTK